MIWGGGLSANIALVFYIHSLSYPGSRILGTSDSGRVAGRGRVGMIMYAHTRSVIRPTPINALPPGFAMFCCNSWAPLLVPPCDVKETKHAKHPMTNHGFPSYHSRVWGTFHPATRSLQRGFAFC